VRMGVREGGNGPPFQSGVPGGGLGTESGMPGMASEGDGGVGTGPQGVGLALPRPTSGSRDPSSFDQGTRDSVTSAGDTVRAGDPRTTRTGDETPSGNPSIPELGHRQEKAIHLRPPRHGYETRTAARSGTGSVPGETPDPNAKPPSKTDVNARRSTSAGTQKADSARGVWKDRQISEARAGDWRTRNRVTDDPGSRRPSFPRAPRNGGPQKVGAENPKPFRLTGNRDWYYPD